MVRVHQRSSDTGHVLTLLLQGTGGENHRGAREGVRDGARPEWKAQWLALAWTGQAFKGGPFYHGTVYCLSLWPKLTRCLSFYVFFDSIPSVKPQ